METWSHVNFISELIFENASTDSDSDLASSFMLTLRTQGTLVLDWIFFIASHLAHMTFVPLACGGEVMVGCKEPHKTRGPANTARLVITVEGHF